MRRPRSGSHLVKRGDIYHYRRVVPAELRKVFGRTEVTRSLDTSSEVEAKRLEKTLDVEFEERLRTARESRDPAKLAANVANLTPISITLSNEWGIPAGCEHLTASEKLAALSNANEHLVPRHRLLIEISDALAPLAGDQIARVGPALLSIIRQQVGRATAAPAVVTNEAHTLEWAYERWLRKRSGRRVNESVRRARAHLDEFIAHSELILLADVRRSHLLAWRDSLIDARKYAANSLNHRISFVSAILRAGWADAELPEQNLRDLALATDDEKQRVSWDRENILTAVHALKPQSWSAWLFLLGLTTGVRIGEPTAARVGWWNPRTSMIEVDDPRYTKANKRHVMAVIDCLREPMLRLVAGRNRNDYLLADAPRPANEMIPISHETSKWFGRFFDRHGIDRIYHELRHSWIEEAKHSPVERDVWEILSGHSPRTVSDRYGGKKPDVLLAANETICNFLTGDAELKAAMLRLVC